MLNNPLRYTDPSGHWYYDPGCDCMVANGKPEYEFAENLSYHRNYNRFDLTNIYVFAEPEVRNKAYGVRLESSAWAITGLDLNVDMLYFTETREFGLFTTFGGQSGTGGGEGFTFGFLNVSNVLKRSDYGGPSRVMGGMTVPVISFPLSIEIDQSFGQPNPGGSTPVTNYYGIGIDAGLEVGLYEGGGYTVDWMQVIEDIFSILNFQQ